MVLHDVLLYYLLNITSAFYLSAVHNALYFVLDWHTDLLHFWHYCLTFFFLLFCSMIGMKRCSKSLPIASFILPITTQIIIVLLTNQVHSQIRSGSLYLIRYFSYLSLTKKKDIQFSLPKFGQNEIIPQLHFNYTLRKFSWIRHIFQTVRLLNNTYCG